MFISVLRAFLIMYYMAHGNRHDVPNNVKFIFVTGSDEKARSDIIFDLKRTCDYNCMFDVVVFPEEHLHPAHHFEQLCKVIKSFAGMKFPIWYQHVNANYDGVETDKYSTFTIVVETVSVHMIHYVPIIQSILHAYHEHRKGNPAFPSALHENDLEVLDKCKLINNELKVLNKCKLINNEYVDTVFAEDFIIIDTDSTNENLIANHSVIEGMSDEDTQYSPISYYDLDLVEYDRIVTELESVYFRTSFYRNPVEVSK